MMFFVWMLMLILKTMKRRQIFKAGGMPQGEKFCLLGFDLFCEIFSTLGWFLSLGPDVANEQVPQIKREQKAIPEAPPHPPMGLLKY